MHILAAQMTALDVTAILAYLLLLAFLGWLGYRQTKTAADYMLAGRKAHPAVMALSYGATFISTSAIVGFGGTAGTFGMSLLWLTFLNIFVGIFIAFVVLGGRIRAIGHRLNAHTFPELLGRRFESRAVQVLAGLVIFFFMPLYAAAVIIGGAEFMSTQFELNYTVTVLIFVLVVAAYVMAGGLKAVMYTDALQGVIMFVGMMILLIYTYASIGGITEGHRTLTDLKDLVPQSLVDQGHQGWTAMPLFGFGAAKYNLWWTVITTITLGVGIGVLAQPQLAVRFMTVKSKRELNRAVLVGGIFILAMTGVAFTVGALSNAYFSLHGDLFQGRVVKTIDAQKGHFILQLMKKQPGGAWVDVTTPQKQPDGTTIEVGTKVPAVLDKDKPYLDDAAKFMRAGAGTTPSATDGKIAQGRSISLVYAKKNDSIIPTYIAKAMPSWFGLLFMLTLLAAAMSTLSSQLHASGTSLGHDVYGTLSGQKGSIGLARLAIIIGLILATWVSLQARSEMIIARATSIFMGLCASAFLPSLLGGLYWKRMTRPAVLASMIVGFAVTAFWLTFVKSAEADAIGLVKLVAPAGKTSILWDRPNWPVVDPIVIALPLSAIVAVVVSLLTKAPATDHLDRCFGNGAADASIPAAAPQK
jgi:solute:Na+ symporter, SSS family